MAEDTQKKTKSTKKKPKKSKKPAKKEKKLTPRQRIFVERYLVHKNASKAALEAGYSQRTAPKQGSENLQKPEIRAAIDAEMAELTKRNRLDADWVLKRLMAIADTHTSEVFKVDENGSWKLKDETEIDRLKLLSVVAFKETDTSGDQFSRIDREVRLADKVRALSELLKYQMMGAKNAGSGDQDEDRRNGLAQLSRAIDFFKATRASK